MAIALSAAIATGCVDRAAQAQAKRTEENLSDRSVPVTLAEATSQTVPTTVEITGAITTGNDTQLGAKVAGRIVAVFVNDGDPVSAGQTIAQQDTTDLSMQVRQAQAGVDAAQAQLQSAITSSEVMPTRSSNAVRLAEERLAQAKAQLEKVLNGARIEERRQAESAVAAARSNMETAKLSLDRGKELYEEGAISKAQIDQRENAYAAALSQYETALEAQNLIQKGAREEDVRTAEAEVRAAERGLTDAKANQKLDVQYDRSVDAARANLRSAQQQLAMARQALSDAAIRSPFNGRVSGRPAQVGTFVGPGTPVARIVSKDGVYFEGQVPESQIEQMTPGTPVEVRIEALDRMLQGVVTAVNPLGNDVARLFSVRVSLQGDVTGVMPGMFARGSVQIGEPVQSVWVPTIALVGTGVDRTLFVVGDGDVAKAIAVKAGREDGDLTEVTGIDPGTRVIVRGAANLQDGATVRVDSEPEAAPQATKE